MSPSSLGTMICLVFATFSCKESPVHHSSMFPCNLHCLKAYVPQYAMSCSRAETMLRIKSRHLLRVGQMNEYNCFYNCHFCKLWNLGKQIQLFHVIHFNSRFKECISSLLFLLHSESILMNIFQSFMIPLALSADSMKKNCEISLYKAKMKKKKKSYDLLSFAYCFYFPLQSSCYSLVYLEMHRFY